MKKKEIEPTTATKKTLDRLCEELGADTIKKLHKAFTLTAAALYKRAQQKAEAELLKADQYRTTEPSRR
jgi:hypothetical protein